ARAGRAVGAQRHRAPRSEQLQMEGPLDPGHSSSDTLEQGGLRGALSGVPGEAPEDPRREPAGRGDGRALHRAEEARDEALRRREVRRKSRRLRGRDVRGEGLLPAAGGLHHVFAGRHSVLRGVPARDFPGDRLLFRTGLGTRDSGLEEGQMSFARGIRLAGFARKHLGRMGRGRREVMAHLENPSADNLPMPTFLQLRVTNLCNLRCKMCGQWGDTGIYRSDGFPASATDGEKERKRIQELIGAKRQLALADYVRLLDEVAPFQPIVSLFGGEPFLYPDIIPLIREGKKRGLTCTIITNGGRLEKHARELVEAGMDSVAVSIDGPPEVHDRIRGQKGAYEKAIAGVRAVARWRKELGRVL